MNNKEINKIAEEKTFDYQRELGMINSVSDDHVIARRMGFYDGFIAGAEWQASQMPMPEDTALFQKGVAEGRRLEREDMMKDGNVILAEEDFDAEKEKSMEWGYNLCKEQMLKEALEGYVAQRVHGKLYAKAPILDEMGFDFGDKVRIIVCKKED